ncbi:MAG: DUF1289 domain-containing protein [Melioribacteraceae bacterium]|nr:DUF1289 domain-containing protein [Melioribacteraceae bacterium]
MNNNSPCNNRCEIDSSLNLCKGCYRTLQEIISWGMMSDFERLQVLKLVEARKQEYGKKSG